MSHENSSIRYNIKLKEKASFPAIVFHCASYYAEFPSKTPLPYPVSFFLMYVVSWSRSDNIMGDENVSLDSTGVDFGLKIGIKLCAILKSFLIKHLVKVRCPSYINETLFVYMFKLNRFLIHYHKKKIRGQTRLFSCISTS